MSFLNQLKNQAKALQTQRTEQDSVLGAQVAVTEKACQILVPYLQDLARQLNAAYDNALSDFDLLLMPTVPLVATPLPPVGAAVEEVVARAFEMLPNTCPFDVTGHPAMSIPCGLVDGLPVGLMLVAKNYDEATIYRAAYAFEQAGDWKAV